MKLRLVLTVASLAALSSACVNGYTVNRGLHYIVDDEGNEVLVRSSPPAPPAYEAYLRARLALERTPADLDAARSYAFTALRWEPKDATLWLLLADIEWRAGNREQAQGAVEQALDLRPDYGEALALRAELGAPAGGE